MFEYEREIYLMNLIAIARADDVVMLEEQAYLSAVAQEIGADRKLLTSVIAGPRPEKIDLIGLRRYSDRVRCVEDMIGLSMADEDVAPEEKKMLFLAAREVDISPELMGILVEEAKRRHKG